MVAGGSLGGLTAALVLHDLGCDVDLFERSASALDGRGAGIVLHPDTERYLHETGATPVKKVSTESRRLRYLSADGSVEHEAACVYRFTAWNTLYRALLACFPTRRYHLGESLVGFEQDESSVTAILASGRRERADLLVCADGVKSTARSLLLPDSRPSYSGYVGWRGTALESELSAAARLELGSDINYHLMRGSHILTYPIPGPQGELEPGCRQINFVWYRNVDQGAALDALMTDRDGIRRELSVPPGLVRPEFVTELRQAGRKLPPAMRELIERTAEPFIQEIVDVAVPRMAFGRVCLLGDAAFVARPHAAAGTAKAASDAWAVREELVAHGGDVRAALAAYDRRQLALARALMTRVRELGDASQFGSGWRAGDPDLRFGLRRPGDSEDKECD